MPPSRSIKYQERLTLARAIERFGSEIQPLVTILAWLGALPGFARVTTHHHLNKPPLQRNPGSMMYRGK